MPRPLTTQPLPYSTATRSGSKLTSDIIEQREVRELSKRCWICEACMLNVCYDISWSYH